MPIWMVVTEWSARAILAILVLLSIWSIAIIIDRRIFFKKLDVHLFFDLLKNGAKEFSSDSINLALSPLIFKKRTEMEKGLSVLGTLGSTTPFIGLLGTILGIIVAFGELSQGKGDTNAVMFALAEALILTAVGLFVAIPAVIAFNIYNKKIRSFFSEIQSKVDHHIAKKDL